MKPKSRPRCAMNVGRWASYAAAGAAMVGAASNDAEGAILYSGALNKVAGESPPVWLYTLTANSHHGPKDVGAFGAEQFNANFGYAWFSMATHTRTGNFVQGTRAVNGKFAGISANGSHYPSNLALGVNVSAGLHFIGPARGDMASTFSTPHPNAKFRSKAIGFLAFEFNLGGGEQYGWARVNMTTGATKNNMTVIDYAYGTPGQAITVGEEAVMPEPASLGLLALGSVGLLAARLGGKRKIPSAAD